MSSHIVKAFDEQLEFLNQTVARMGGIAESQLDSAIAALSKRDSDIAASVLESDRALDELEHTVEEAALRLLALRQPMATDLREVMAAFKASHDIERIGDYSVNMAKRALALNQLPPVGPVKGVARMARMVQTMVKDTFDAYLQRDAAKALEVWRRDEEVDEMYTTLFREMLTYMMEDPRNITPCTHLLFIAKNVERMGDHATNIDEVVHFLVTGRYIDEHRPKGDSSSYAVVEPGGEDHEGKRE